MGFQKLYICRVSMNMQAWKVKLEGALSFDIHDYYKTACVRECYLSFN